jgi:hypothetical protein
LANDKTLESINIKIETLSSALKNQLVLVKWLKHNLHNLLVLFRYRKNFRATRGSRWKHGATGWGNPSRRPSRTNHAGRTMRQKANAWEGFIAAIQGYPVVPMISVQSMIATTIRPFVTLGKHKHHA